MMAVAVLTRSTGRVSPQTILIVGPAFLLASALAFQFVGGLHPCELCMWQRWPHVGAIVFALIVLPAPNSARRLLLVLAGLAVLTSAGIGIVHVGVENHWWTGPTACSAPSLPSGDFLANMIAAPIVRCDAPAWSLFGISMAGFNVLLSGLIGLVGLRGAVRDE